MIEVNDNNFYVDVIEKSSEIPILVDFWAPWCQPCLILGPVLEKIEREFPLKSIKEMRNATEKNPDRLDNHLDLANQY